MYASPNAARLLTEGLAEVRRSCKLPGEFPADALAEADGAVQRGLPTDGRADLTDVRFVTLDPASSTDLDQAFALDRDGETFVLRYAIADLSAFSAPAGPLETEAWNRASTLYLPDEKIPQYPTRLSEGAASLLPDLDRPAVVMTVRLGTDLVPMLDSIERGVVRSRAKLAYETVSPEEAHPLLAAFAARMTESDHARGAERIERPEQEIDHDDDAPGSLRLRFRLQTASEQANSALSLAANLALAGHFIAHGVGIFRDLDDPSGRDLGMLRRTAKALGLQWDADEELRDVLRRVRPEVSADATFSIAVRRAGGGAQYRFYTQPEDGAPLISEGKTGSPSGPWHSAMGAPYAHGTAPLRRLADRYALDLAVALAEGQRPEDALLDKLQRLPPVMDKVGRLASTVDRACIDLVEAVILLGREGEEFDAVVAETAGPTAVVHLLAEGVRVRMPLRGVNPGDPIRLRLTAVDPAKALITFAVVGPNE